MAFNAIDNTRVNAAKHQDDWYAAEVVAGKEIPYASVAAACAAIPSAVRMKGRACIITVGGITVEHWWKDDLTDSGLIVKTVDISGKANQSDLLAEVTNRTNADTTLDGKITTETTNRNTAITTEITNRTNADTLLDGRITTESTNRVTAITAEQNRATIAEVALQNSVNTNAAEIPKTVDFGLNLKGVAAQSYVQSNLLIGMIPKGVYKGKFYTVGASGITPTDNPPLVAFNTTNGRINFDQPLDADEDVWVLYSQAGNTAIIPGSVALTSDLLNYAPVRQGVNLFDSTNYVAGSSLSNTGAIAVNAIYFYTSFIPVTPGQTIYFSKDSQPTTARYVAIYDSSFALITGGMSNSAASYLIPSGVSYVKVTGNTADLPNFQIEVGGVTAYRKKGKLIDPELYFDPISLAKTGAGVVRLVTEKISPLDVQFLSMSKNLFNKNTVTSGKAKTETGAIVTNATLYYSDLIPGIAGDVVYSSFNGVATTMRYTTFYDMYGNVIPGGSNTSINTATFPTRAKFFSFSALLTQINAFQVEKTAVTSFVDYTATGNPYLRIPESVSRPSGIRLTADKIPATDAGFFIQSANIFDKRTAASGKFMGKDGVLKDNTNNFVSDYIPVTEAQLYVSSKNGVVQTMRFLAAFNASKAVVPASGSDLAISSYTPPSGIAFIRFTGNVSDLPSFQLEKDSITAYAKYGFNFTPEINVADPPPTLKTVTEGDSTVEQNQWQPFLDPALALTITNLGVGGTRLSGSATTAMWQDARVNLFPTDTEIILLLCLINDWAQSVALGSLTSTDTNDVSGAFNTWVPKALARCVNASIFIMTPTFCRRIGTLPTGWVDGYTNNLGLTINDYADHEKLLARKWNLQVIDTNQSGWNKENIGLIVPDGFHFQAQGGKRVARKVIDALKNYIKL